MKRARNCTFVILLGLGSVPLSTTPASEISTKPSKPNVLFMAVDDLRTSLGCYGDTLVKSPNIDRLAATSRRFTQAYCHQAVCGPSRTSILTGRLPDNTRVWHNRNLFRDTLPNAVTLPEYFKNHGYHAQSLGKVFSGRDKEEEQDPQSWSVPPLLKGPGWSNYALPENQGHSGKGIAAEMADVPDEGYSDGKLAAVAVKTLEDLSKQKQPFFLAVGFFKPHLPFCAPKKYWDLYDPADLGLSDNATRSARRISHTTSTVNWAATRTYRRTRNSASTRRVISVMATTHVSAMPMPRWGSCLTRWSGSAWRITRSSSSGATMGTRSARAIVGARVRTSKWTRARR